MNDRTTEISWDHQGRYTGVGRGAPLDRTKRIRRRWLSPKRAHACLSPMQFESTGQRSTSLVVEHQHGGCGVFICARCRQPTPWCAGAADDAPLLCDFCWSASA